jgi:hypothetical protein
MTQANESNDEDAVAELLDAELPRQDDDLPPLDFSTFVVSLRTSALMHMGQGESADLNLAMARQEIDLLAILEEKTRGNLTGDEELLLSQVLFDLRTRYITACSKS